CLVAGAGYVLYRLVLRAKRRLLWRVRRKLILSYIFIGFVPALLIVAFFVVAGLMLFLNVGSYLVRSGLRDVSDEARFLADTTVREIERGQGPLAAQSVLVDREASLASRYPGAAIALVPTADARCTGRAGTPATAQPAAGTARAGAALPVIPAVAVGRWVHVDPPRLLPAWVNCSGFSGTVAVTMGPADAAGGGGGQLTDEDILLVVRAIALPQVARPRYGVIVDIPVSDGLKARLREDTSVKLGRVSVVLPAGDQPALPMRGRQPATGPAAGAAAPPVARSEVSPKARWTWVALVEFTDWTTGWIGETSVSIEVSIADIYDRISAGQARSGPSTGRVFLVVLLLLAILFLIIECAALVMGLLLAKSITGSVHQLFMGTGRARAGDFGHKIAVVARDQLGELAESFNQMTGSIEDLMRQAQEKRRLEEELRIARAIQMSLLPQGPLSIPGVSVTALCVPAREVGGDYYDLFPLGDGRYGLLIADVSGKGTSAAFYMAELKGLMLSLSRIHRSPRELLVNANRIISDHLDSRSFITMIYAVIDAEARTMTYARAGHTPLIVRTGGHDGEASVQILVPDGMVLGVRIDHGELFERLLEESTIPLGCGDVLLFFTDGISEAMNVDSDCFGETRLARLIEEHGDLAPEELRERILREIQAFVGDAPQHDDMTMILLKVDPAEAKRERAPAAAEAA
ncbi:MAG: SpoIIE family protein phosphatase, partial [Acidobacteria bacterium]|nr:SpoIIE family protein phosphatase [Acidobacteriota bacterium]